MAKPKIIKPGTVVFDVDHGIYVQFKGYAVGDVHNQVYVQAPAKFVGTFAVDHHGDAFYLTTMRPLNRKERGE